MKKGFYTCEEIAEFMGIKISTIRTYCRQGKIPSIKVGRSYHISVKDFEEWCEEKKQVPPGAETRKYLRKLKESEVKHKNLVNQSLDGIVMTDFKNTIVLANPSFCKMLEYSEEELLGTNLTQYFHPDERAQAVEDHMRRIAGEVDPQPKTARLLKKSGKTVFAEILGSPTWESGKIVGVQKIIRDVTGRKKLEQELETIIDLVPDALMITDFKGKIYRINKSVEEFSGYTKEELLNMDSVINMYYYPEERANALAMLKEKGEFHNFEFTAQIKGVLMPGEMSARVVEIGGEKYIESLVRDITQRKRLQDKLREAKETLETAFNAVNFGIVFVGTDLRVQFANDWVKKRIPGIALGKTCSILLEEGEEPFTTVPCQKCLKSGKPEKIETTTKRPDGTLFRFRLGAYPIKNEDGSVNQIVLSILELGEKQKPGWDVLSL